jgi:hypothetical protein
VVVEGQMALDLVQHQPEVQAELAEAVKAEPVPLAV